MAMPPNKNTNNSITVSYFDFLVKEVSPLFEKNGVILNFEGYGDLAQKYNRLSFEDLELAWQIASEANAWTAYLNDLMSTCAYLLRNAETDKIAIFASASIEADSAKVANGDRLANKDPRVISLRRERNLLESFLDALKGRVEFLERVHYFCKTTYDLQKRGS